MVISPLTWEFYCYVDYKIILQKIQEMYYDKEYR